MGIEYKITLKTGKTLELTQEELNELTQYLPLNINNQYSILYRFTPIWGTTKNTIYKDNTDWFTSSTLSGKD